MPCGCWLGHCSWVHMAVWGCEDTLKSHEPTDKLAGGASVRPDDKRKYQPTSGMAMGDDMNCRSPETRILGPRVCGGLALAALRPLSQVDGPARGSGRPLVHLGLVLSSRRPGPGHQPL